MPNLWRGGLGADIKSLRSSRIGLPPLGLLELDGINDWQLGEIDLVIFGGRQKKLIAGASGKAWRVFVIHLVGTIAFQGELRLAG